MNAAHSRASDADDDRNRFRCGWIARQGGRQAPAERAAGGQARRVAAGIRFLVFAGERGGGLPPEVYACRCSGRRRFRFGFLPHRVSTYPASRESRSADSPNYAAMAALFATE
jgi:hypothetical protein